MPGIPPGESDYRPVVYVTGQYSHEDPTARNRTKLEEGIDAVLSANGAPVCPAFQFFDTTADDEYVTRAGLNILSKCEALYVLTDSPASNTPAGIEIAAATTWDIPVFTDEESLFAWIADQLGSNGG